MTKNKAGTSRRPLAIGLIALLIIALAASFLAGNGRASDAHTAAAADALPARPAAGHPAPDFTLTGLDGEEFRLADLRGKPVILNFWASWCGPCRVEMPHLQAAYEEYAGDDVVVVGVNLTQRESRLADVSAFVDEFGLTFPVVLDKEDAVADLYEVRGQPASVFIDRNGVVDTVFYGPVNRQFIDERIADLLGS